MVIPAPHLSVFCRRLRSSFWLTLATLACWQAAVPSHAGAANITAVWANDGGDKVTQDDLRAAQNAASVQNSVWNGTTVSLFGGRNETVSFNLILEAANAGASNVSVTFNKLAGPSGQTIASSPATGNGVFSWTSRPIELFYVRYLQINGLSLLAYWTGDEEQIPQRLQRPWTGTGVGSGTWQDRPDHNKFYPEIAVPLELVPSFSIAAGHNQSIWVDVYIPKSATPGNYTGTVTIQEGGAPPRTVPVQLQVYNFTLPDTPYAKTMVDYTDTDINKRFFGNVYVNPSSAQGPSAQQVRDRYFMMAHRHKISLIGDDINDCGSNYVDQPCPEWLPRLNGSLFTAANNYDGAGVGVGNNVYSIGTYGSWNWQSGGQSAMNQHTNAWATWFMQNAPQTEYFLYLIDESTITWQIQQWSQWILSNTGPGQNVRSMATIALPTASSQCPALDIPTSTLGVGIPSQWTTPLPQYTNSARQRFYMYNGSRPASGSFATDDDGVALREMPWGQYKEHINRWFYWESTYYNNYQAGAGDTDLFNNAHTFGSATSIDPILGETGWNHTNGDGVLFYPGTDLIFPADSYGVMGPFASLRLKQWRRGIQDVDYLTLAAAIDPTTVQNLVNSIVPKAEWEYGVTDVNDPSYVFSAVSWSNNPDVW
ncbi:MAG TPA: glycoside hydrolase domain-containing protein, partial [Elusimicrobiota bacterium]|nr:glycoside hydrolase domain-containing protein [Elusimicrobiota bacterium]